jgi:hypothetical protein
VALTIKEIESAKPKDKKYKLADGGGLCLLIQPWDGKFWLWRYRFDGSEKNMTFGEYPLVPLKDARELHFAAKKLLATGVNPMAERKAEADAKQRQAEAQQREAEPSFEKVARKWWAWWSIGKPPRHAKTVMNRLEADVLPVIGHLYVDAVEPIGLEGSGFHSLCDEAFQLWLDRAIVVRHDVPARLRPPGGAFNLLGEQVGDWRCVFSPNELLLVLTQVTGKVLDAVWFDPNATVCNFDVRKDLRDGELSLQALRGSSASGASAAT